MPVARLTNVTSYDSLLQEIRDFLNATGDWTIHEDMVVPTTPAIGYTAGGHKLTMSNGDVLTTLRSTTTTSGANRLMLFAGSGTWTTAVDDFDLPGSDGCVLVAGDYTSTNTPPCKHCQQFAGPFPRAWIFTDDPSTYCHVAIEVVAGRYRHMHFGNIEKFGTWTGGAYYETQWWSQSVTYIDSPHSNTHYIPFDAWESSGPSVSNRGTIHFDYDSTYYWGRSGGGTLNGVASLNMPGSCRGGMGMAFRAPRETLFSALTALIPITKWYKRTSDTPDTTRCVGRIKDIAWTNIANFTPGESYYIGSDEWILIPATRKQDPTLFNDLENSGWYAYAYKVIPSP